MTTLTVSSNRQLQTNLKLGQEINSYVSKKVPIIFNYLERCDIDYEKESQELGSSVNMVALNQLASMIFEMAYTPVACREFSIRNLRKIAAVAKKVGIGTCLEMSALALDYCLEKKVPQKAELFYLEGGNHVFLVLDRNQKSKPSDYKSWGKQAVICDTWSGKVFAASKIESKLKNFSGNQISGDRVLTKLEPFDPDRHIPSLLIKSKGATRCQVKGRSR